GDAQQTVRTLRRVHQQWSDVRMAAGVNMRLDILLHWVEPTGCRCADHRRRAQMPVEAVGSRRLQRDVYRRTVGTATANISDGGMRLLEARRWPAASDRAMANI